MGTPSSKCKGATKVTKLARNSAAHVEPCMSQLALSLIYAKEAPLTTAVPSGWQR